MTAPIVFYPNPDNSVGGTICLMTPLTELEIFQLYQQWREENGVGLNELSYDAAENYLNVGFWEIVAHDSVEGDIDLNFGTLAGQEEEQVQEAPEAPAQAQPVAQAEQPSVEEREIDPTAEEVKAILQPTTQLDVRRIYDPKDVRRLKAVARSTTVQGAQTAMKIEAAGAVGTIKAANAGGSISLTAAQSSVSRKPPPGRLMVSNLPEHQIRLNQEPYRESNTMGNSHKSDRKGGNAQQHDARNDSASNNGNKNKNMHPQQHEPRSERAAPRHANKRGDPNDDYRINVLNPPPKPANMAMIDQLLKTGVGGQSVSTFDTSAYVDQVARRASQTADERQQMADGFNCINISPIAETDLGKALRLSQQRPFEHTTLGRFESLAGLFMMLMNAPLGPDLHYSTIYGAQANRVLKDRSHWRAEIHALTKLSRDELFDGWRGALDLPMIYAIMADCVWKVVNQDANLVAALLSNRLPLECYMLGTARDKQTGSVDPDRPKRIVSVDYASWYVPILRSTVYTLHRRIDHMRRGGDPEQLESPNFDRAILQGLKHTRRSLINEMRWREIGCFAYESDRRSEAAQPQAGAAEQAQPQQLETRVDPQDQGQQQRSGKKNKKARRNEQQGQQTRPPRGNHLHEEQAGAEEDPNRFVPPSEAEQLASGSSDGAGDEVVAAAGVEVAPSDQPVLGHALDEEQAAPNAGGSAQTYSVQGGVGAGSTSGGGSDSGGSGVSGALHGGYGYVVSGAIVAGAGGMNAGNSDYAHSGFSGNTGAVNAAPNMVLSREAAMPASDVSASGLTA